MSTEEEKPNRLDQLLSSSHRERLRHAQVRSIFNLSPAVVLTNAVLAGLLVWMESKQAISFETLVWLGLLLSFLTIHMFIGGRQRLMRHRYIRGDDIKTEVPGKFSFFMMHLGALTHGLLWGYAAVHFAINGVAEMKAVLAIGIASVMLAGGVFYAAIPMLVVMYVLPMAAGGLLAIHLEADPNTVWPLFATLVWLAVSTPVIARFYSKMFTFHLSTIEKSKEQTAVLNMLLSELEQDAVNWVWETDAKGRLLRFPENMLPKSGDEVEIYFQEYLSRIAIIKGTQLEDLAEALKQNEPFRDVVVCTNWGEGESWIRLGGHPTHDEDGRVAGFVGTGVDVTTEKLAEDRIERLSQNDPLTGLMNRTAFSAQLAQSVAELERLGRPFTVLYMDLDGFKLINDTRGHLYGDRLLAEASDRISDQVRDVDYLARLGGDEFAVLIDGQGDAGAAARLAARLIGEVSKPYLVDEEELRVGISVGIALAPLNGTRPDQLLRNADLALYRAKADGRGVFRFFENNMDSEMRERRMLEAELRDAVSNNEMVLHYQPLVDGRTKAIKGMESLVRWQHPIRGLLSPIEFVELAEETNIISEIGNWTLHEACKTAINWPEHTFVAVNLSPRHFMQADIVEEVQIALATSGLAPERLELEITESLLIDNTREVIDRLEKIKSLGVSVAMDDFGTGYSSLSYLMSVPFDKLKIDKSFVDQVEDSHAGRKIVQMITTLAKELHLRVTAEGVETEDQSDFLASVGCDTLQGYLFSRPMPEENLAEYFLKTIEKPDAVTVAEKSNERLFGSAASAAK